MKSITPRGLRRSRCCDCWKLRAAEVERNRDAVEIALTAGDIERINRQGKIAAVLDLEGGFDLDGDLAVLRSLYKLGLRGAQLPAHNWANEFADSCCAPKKWNGLNERGRAVIREMNRLGMVINISHASDETIAQAIEVSSGPAGGDASRAALVQQHPAHDAR